MWETFQWAPVDFRATPCGSAAFQRFELFLADDRCASIMQGRHVRLGDKQCGRNLRETV